MIKKEGIQLICWYFNNHIKHNSVFDKSYIDSRTNTEHDTKRKQCWYQTCIHIPDGDYDDGDDDCDDFYFGVKNDGDRYE